MKSTYRILVVSFAFLLSMATFGTKAHAEELLTLGDGSDGSSGALCHATSEIERLMINRDRNTGYFQQASKLDGGDILVGGRMMHYSVWQYTMPNGDRFREYRQIFEGDQYASGQICDF